MSPAWRRALLVLSAALALAGWLACGTDAEAPGGGGGAGSGAAGAGGTTNTSSSSSSTTGSSSSSGAGGEEPCEPEPLPPGVPEGWVEYTDWSCQCRFYVPGSAEALPAPIAWEDCPDAGDGVGCRTMVVDWTDQHGAVAAKSTMAVNPDGTAVLAFARSAPLASIKMVADADGPTRSAILWAHQGKADLHCYLYDGGMNEGKRVFEVEGLYASGLTTKHQGALGGSIDDLRPALLAKELHEDNPYGESWRCGASWLMRYTWPFVLTAHPWDTSTSTVIHSAALDPEGLTASEPLQIVGEAVFFTTANLYRSGINVWDPDHGFRPFIRFVGDWTRGAGNLGTDGVDLVWSYGEGKEPGGTLLQYPIRSVMTAPFTTDPAAVVPRRLRSEPPLNLAENRWQVGCGYAAHDGVAASLFVVRLSDGWSWTLPGVTGRTFYQALGITCNEVFALGSFGDHANIARIRLDSLGLGSPPD